jgi:NAD(P)-dependent dehydrogenase (short-subunit alcohol dehydrogenase family)
MNSFEGKVAAITGAGSGIGRALAVALAKRGCNLALSDVNEAGVAETARAAASVHVTTARVDVAERAQIEQWAEAVRRDHGGCNLIINNAGVALGATAEAARPEDFAWIMSINFWGVVHGTQAFLPLLRAAGEGHVVNLSSLFGLIAFPGQSAYNASKFAVRGYTEALRVELKMGGARVSATCVHPGGIKTNIARASRMDPSLRDIGVADLEGSRESFSRAFRVTAEDAAQQILRGVERDAARVLIGADARVLDFAQRLFPGGYGGVMARVARRLLSSARPG